MSNLAEAGSRLLGGVLVSWERLQGGNLSQVVLVRLQDGRRAVVKSGPAPRTEAAMLRALMTAGVKAPTVLAVDDTTLVLESIEGGGSLERAWQDLGTEVALLHRTQGPQYGWAQDYAFGPVAIDNGWCETWPAFYAQRRLLTHLPFLTPPLARRIESLAHDLHNRLPRHPLPSLLHGDLWSGNVMVAGCKVAAFIDPACIYGDAEIDLAMLGLFDQPAPVFFEAYGPMAPGHPDRVPIYRLWPALVHLRLFGEAYRGTVERCLNQAGV